MEKAFLRFFFCHPNNNQDKQKLCPLFPLLGPQWSNNGVSDLVARPTFKPEITGVTAGTWVVGETSVITLAGSFSPNSTPIVGGNGVLAKAVTSVSANSLTLEITTAATATPGVRQIWITSPSPQLGTNAPLGSAAQTSVTLQP